jgi:hypothetical protein
VLGKTVTDLWLGCIQACKTTSMRGNLTVSQILVVLFLFQRSRLLVREGENFIPAQNRSRAGDSMCCLTFSSVRLQTYDTESPTTATQPSPIRVNKIQDYVHLCHHHCLHTSNSLLSSGASMQLACRLTLDKVPSLPGFEVTGCRSKTNCRA